MATSSIFENIVIETPEEAEAFVRAIELSELAQKNDKRPRVEGRMATREDIIRLANLRKQKRIEQENGIIR